jgi:hypothetical protein
MGIRLGTGSKNRIKDRQRNVHESLAMGLRAVYLPKALTVL